MADATSVSPPARMCDGTWKYARQPSGSTGRRGPPNSAISRAEHAKVTPSTDLHSLADGFVGHPRPRRLSDRVCKREQVVAGRGRRRRLRRQPDHLPAARGAEPFGMKGTEVVRVRLGVGRERTEHRRLVRVDVGKGRNSLAAACAARARAPSSHEVTVPPGREAAADCRAGAGRVGLGCRRG